MQAEALAWFLKRCGRGVVALTGAGCSTESGIPDYRSPSGLYRRENFKPLTASRFLSSEREQRRYWLRSLLGFSTVASSVPNDSHFALKEMCDDGTMHRVITQNVDGLHHLAYHGPQPTPPPYDPSLYTESAAPLTELHGNIHQVQCTVCKTVTPRRQLQSSLKEVNDALLDRYAHHNNKSRRDAPQPDGDFEIGNEWTDQFTLVKCNCGGSLRPYVVMFGENVPSEKVEKTFETVRRAPGLVCLGTSLQVYSALRFVQAAHESGVPVLIANNGVTRGDPFAVIKLETPSVGQLLKQTSVILKKP